MLAFLYFGDYLSEICINWFVHFFCQKGLSRQGGG